jgi:predicted nucleic acid-binding protein
LRLFRRCRPTLICAPISHGIATLAKFDSFAADVAFTHHSRTGRQAMETLKNKRAIVTGGSKGLGLAIVEALLAREAEVVAIARDEERFGLAREAGAQMIAGDATDADLMNRLIVEQAPDILAPRNEGRMTTAVDTNVVMALWDKDLVTSLAAQNALDAAFHRGTLVAAAPVFAELIAAPGRSETFVGTFFEETGIGVDWELTEQIWRLAGRAFQAYAERRRKQRDAGARRILVDFVIGAHAATKGCRLLTLDDRLYRSAFPTLAIETF